MRPLRSIFCKEKIRKAYTDLPPEKKKQKIEHLRSLNRKVHKEGLWNKRNAKASVQYLNSNGTCDLQAKHQFWQEYKELGRIPMWREMSNKLKALVDTRFDSYRDACLQWGITQEEFNRHENFVESESQKRAYEARKEQDFFPQYTREQVEREMNNFIEKHDRLPTWSEAEREGFPTRKVFKRLFGTQKKVELAEIFDTNI